MRLGIVKYISGVITAIAFAAVAHAGFAPNLYELHGHGVQVTYSATSLTGEPMLTYTSGTQTKTYRGKEVIAERTMLGTLVTVTTEFNVDVNFVTFSVLIPDINVFKGPERFSTQAFVTNHSTPFTLPPGPLGPVQTYRTFKMSGKASMVAYVAPPTSGITGTIMTNTCMPSQPPEGCVLPFGDAPIEVLDASGNVVAKATANIDGVYGVDVVPGSYVVHIVTNGIFPSCPDTKADVTSGAKAVVDVLCTAIR